MKQYRIACCLSTYKRLDNMQLQIYQMLNQDYENFHLFVACKGISEYLFHEWIEPQFIKYVEAGKLTLRYFPNKNQLSNFFDTIRDIDISGYDYFCKIDDDDLYSQDYLKKYNEFANKYPDSNFYYKRWGKLVRYNQCGFSSFEEAGSEVFYGPTICMKREIVEELRKAESSVELLKEFLKSKNLPDSLLRCGFIEDRLFCCSMEKSMNVFSLNPEEIICINFSNASTTRQGFLDKDFLEKNAFFNKNPDCYEHILAIYHPKQGVKNMRIFNKKANYLFAKWEAKVKEFTNNFLALEWSNNLKECFHKKDNGLWVLEEKS